jgi:hypothetical protein
LVIASAFQHAACKRRWVGPLTSPLLRSLMGLRQWVPRGLGYEPAKRF